MVPTSEAIFEDDFGAKKGVNFENEDCNIVYERIIKEAPRLPGDCNIPIFPKDIPWLQPTLLREGRAFVKRNYFSVFFSIILAALCGFGIKPICLLFLRSGKFHKFQDSSFLKLLSTANRILTWFQDDILCETSNAYKNIEVTRIMHKVAADWKNRDKEVPLTEEMEIEKDTEMVTEALQKDLDFIDTSKAPNELFTWTPAVEFSQFDNTISLWGFYSAPKLLAKLIGIGDFKYYDGFRHSWAVMGRLLGIEDRFNLALHDSPELSERILNNIIIPSLKSTDLTSMVAQNTHMKAAGRAIFILRYKPVVYLLAQTSLPDFKGENLYAMMSFYDKLCLLIIVAGTKLVFYFGFIRRFANWGATLLMGYHMDNHFPKYKQIYPIARK